MLLKSYSRSRLFLPSSGNLDLMSYCDASWLSCPSIRRSYTSYYVSLGGFLVSWRTKKQIVVAQSLAEAEYHEIASTICKVICLRWLLKDFDVDKRRVTPLMCNNEVVVVPNILLQTQFIMNVQNMLR